MAGKGKKKDETEKNFEEQMDRLEEIVGQLESEEVSLEKALELFDEGTTLVRSAQKKLKESRMKVQKVLGEEDGEVVLERFSFGAPESEEDDAD